MIDNPQKITYLMVSYKIKINPNDIGHFTNPVHYSTFKRALTHINLTKQFNMNGAVCYANIEDKMSGNIWSILFL